MKTKKILAVVLSVIMLLSSAPLGGLVGLYLPDVFKTEASAEEYEYNGFYYRIIEGDEDDEVKITGCNESKSGELIIPDSIDGYPVTSIGYRAFDSCKSLTSVTIGNSVASIGSYAFYRCTSLTSITIGNSVASIGDYAFRYCSSLTSVEIPDSVTSIGDWAFSDCTSLTSISVSEENEYYSSDSYGVLYNKNKTELIRYPMGNSRTSFTIPNSVTSIGDWAFYDCTSLTSITIGNSVTSIGIYAFLNCESLTSIEIPDSVTSIEYSAFYGCESLTSVTIPDSVTSIGEGAFDECKSLTSFFVSSNNKSYSSDSYGVLYNKDKTTLIQYPAGNRRTSFIIPDSVTSIGDWAFSDCESLTSVEIPDSVTSIGDSAFSDCTSLTSVTIGNSVTSIGGSAFYYCKSLTSVEIPDSVTSIGDLAFSDCESLTSVEIPDSVTSIGNNAFYGCDSLTSVEIPDSVTSIGNNAFYGCDSLTSISVSEENENYSSDSYGVLYNKNKTELIQYPIGNSRTSFIIFDSVTSIGNSAFEYCYSLTSVTIGDSVTSIGNYAFYSCDSLTSVTIGNSVTSIGYRTFYGCTSLISIEIPDSVTSIDMFAIGYYWDEDEDDNLKINNFTIYGNKNTAAEEYADDNGFKFISLGEAPHTHTFGNWTVTKPATCLNAGTEERACTGCEEKEIREITKLSHSYTGEVKANNDGTHSFKCVNGCNEYGGKVSCSGGTATCKAKAVCSVCEAEYGVYAAHTPVEYTQPATCTVNGYKMTTCSFCLEELDFSVITAKGHIFGEWKVIKEATIENEGIEQRKCINCTETEERPVPKKESVISVDEKSDISVTFDKEAFGGKDAEVEVKEDFTGTQFLAQSYNRFVPMNISIYVDGKEAQPNTPVLVKVPLPDGFDKNNISVFHINSITGVAEKIENVTVENGYISFYTSSFSVFVIADETSCVKNCSHICHKTGIAGFVWKFINFFNKLFKINQYCECGAKHW